MSRLDDKIAQISHRTGYSPAEVKECLVETLDRLLSEGDMAWAGRSASEVVRDTKDDRKQIMVAIHTCSLNVKELAAIARERLNLVQSATLIVSRRMGIAKNLPEVASEEELARAGGYLQSSGTAVISKTEDTVPDRTPET
jgi:hypothetical protein